MLSLRMASFGSLFNSSRRVTPLVLRLLQCRFKYSVEKVKKPTFIPDHEERNEKLKRLLSPHVSIYKFEMPSLQSISHRTSGIILSTYLVILGVGALMLPHDFAYYIEAIDDWELNRALIGVGKFLFALPFTIHFVGGVKHLVWDYAPGLLKNINGVFKAGYIVFTVGIITAALLATITTNPN